MSRLSICVCGIFVFMVLGFSFAAIRFEYRPDEYALGLWHFSERYDNAVEDEAENKIQTVIESEIEWEKDGWNKQGKRKFFGIRRKNRLSSSHQRES